MLTSIQTQVPLIWLGIAILLAIVEIAVPTFGFIFGTLAALVVAAMTALGPVDWPVQLVTFSVMLLIGLFLLRPRLLRKMESSKGIPSRTDNLIGKTGKVIQTIDSSMSSGRVLVEGDDWAARAQKPIAEGANVIVENADGIVLLVKEV